MEGVFTSLPWGDGQAISGADTDANHYATLDHDTQTDTDYAQYRQYANMQGRWLSPDPYSGSYSMRNPQSFNRYVYAGNNPLAGVDPTGLHVYCAPTSNDTSSACSNSQEPGMDNASEDHYAGVGVTGFGDDGGGNSDDGTGSDNGGSNSDGPQVQLDPYYLQVTQFYEQLIETFDLSQAEYDVGSIAPLVNEALTKAAEVAAPYYAAAKAATPSQNAVILATTIGAGAGAAVPAPPPFDIVTTAVGAAGGFVGAYAEKAIDYTSGAIVQTFQSLSNVMMLGW